jgi:polyisoprenoid-binding protein YceI
MKNNTRSKERSSEAIASKYIRYAIGTLIVCLTGIIGLTGLTGFTDFAGFTATRPAPAAYRLTAAGNADIKVLGTSNLHNWTMEAKDITCSAKFNFLPGNGNQPKSLTELSLSVPVKNLKSGESSMDSRAYTALKAKTYTDIAFVLTSATIVPGQKDHFLIRGTGNLSIAGVTNPVSMDVNCQVSPDGIITCIGSEKLKMTDYQIKPPTFMLGALKTGNDLTINFTVVVKK